MIEVRIVDMQPYASATRAVGRRLLLLTALSVRRYDARTVQAPRFFLF
jgi:hypothetical protein